MKNNPLAATLLGMLLVSTIFTALLTYRYVSSLRKLRAMQPVVVQINFNRNIMQALANELEEYSKRNPSLEPLLRSISPKPGLNAPTTGAAKPAGK
jgi:hypothetical protein